MKKKNTKKLINYSDEQKKLLKIGALVEVGYLSIVLIFCIATMIFKFKIPFIVFIGLAAGYFFILPLFKLITGFNKKGRDRSAKSD